MLTCAFDASGGDNTPTLTVAGFVSSVKDWEDFSMQWENRLAEDGIAYFRAAEFAHSNGEFKEGWRGNEPRRRKLTNDLMGILLPCVYRKFGCTIVNKDFGKLDKSLQEDFILTAYSLAARTCIVLVKDWARSEPPMKNQIDFVFEKGDPNQGRMKQQLIHDLGEECEPDFRPKKDHLRKDGSTDYGFIPLQAADWLAYEISCVVRKYGTTQGLPDERDLRWPMQQFTHKVGRLGVYGAEGIELLNNCLKQATEIDLWWKGLGL